MNIKPIETEYNGYRFRSRLEARWAVFFDTVGIKYQYEPEGFDLGDGIKYLPDFYLPEDEVWVEIKGTMPDEKDLEKMLRFGQKVCGDMTETGKRYRCLLGEIPFNGIGDFIPCLIYASREELGKLLKAGSPVNIPKYGAFNHGFWVHNRGLEIGKRAMKKARSARFEHGEKPNIRSVSV